MLASSCRVSSCQIRSVCLPLDVLILSRLYREKRWQKYGSPSIVDWLDVIRLFGHEALSSVMVRTHGQRQSYVDPRHRTQHVWRVMSGGLYIVDHQGDPTPVKRYWMKETIVYLVSFVYFFLTAWVLFYVGRRDILKSRQKWQSTWLAVVNTLTVVSVGKCVSALSFVTFASISKAITCQDRWDVTEQFHHSARFLCRHVEHRMTNCHTLWRQFVAF